MLPPLTRGMRTPMIAEQMQLSVKTVQAYSNRIKTKLRIPNFWQLRCSAARWEDEQVSAI
jgi:DNA-binding NarL/FixJ family response regulator